MKMRGIVLSVLTTVLCCSTSHATITSASWWDDGDGALVCSSTSWDSGASALSMKGDQFWGPGHMVGGGQLSDAGDPRLTLGSSIDNDTNFAWIAYTVNVYMPTNEVPTFTIVNTGTLAPSVDNPNNDWTVASVVEPSSEPVVSSGEFAGDYEGTLNLQGGTPLAIGDELDFGYTIQFSGASHFDFTQEVIPIAVPEPGAIDLVAVSGGLLAGLALIRSRRRK